jgi:hypothetical protein
MPRTLFANRSLFQIGTKAAIVDIPPNYSAADWDKAFDDFATRCKKKGHIPAVHTLYEDQKHYGVYYSWGLANIDGAWFIVHPLPDTDPEDVKRCVSKIRNEQDVVRLHVRPVKQWVEFKLPAR